MSVNFSELQTGKSYSRPTLAALWGYSSFQALSRGVVTPKGDNKIILFVTEEKQQSAEQYTDRLNGDLLLWEGPSDHFAEDRMVRSKRCGKRYTFYSSKASFRFHLPWAGGGSETHSTNREAKRIRTACSLTASQLQSMKRLRRNGPMTDDRFVGLFLRKVAGDFLG